MGQDRRDIVGEPAPCPHGCLQAELKKILKWDLDRIEQ